LAAQKNLALRTNIASGLPAGHGDERRLAQVLLNLVGNAIKVIAPIRSRIEGGIAGCPADASMFVGHQAGGNY
jgi:signal transduction histidine kinase